MGEVVNFFSGWSDHDTLRQQRLMDHGEVPVVDNDDDPGLAAEVAAMGSPDEWAWSAVLYLKASLEGTLGGTVGGRVTVSAAAVGLAIGFIETLAVKTGDIR